MSTLSTCIWLNVKIIGIYKKNWSQILFSSSTHEIFFKHIARSMHISVSPPQFSGRCVLAIWENYTVKFPIWNGAVFLCLSQCLCLIHGSRLIFVLYNWWWLVSGVHVQFSKTKNCSEQQVWFPQEIYFYVSKLYFAQLNRKPIFNRTLRVRCQYINLLLYYSF